jgi:hypothetical protein
MVTTWKERGQQRGQVVGRSWPTVRSSSILTAKIPQPQRMW